MENQFHVTSKWMWVYGVFAGICLAGFLAMFIAIFDKEATETQRICSFPFTSLGYLYFALQSIYGYYQTITMDPNKIYFRTFGLNVEINWHKIKRIGIYKNFFWRYEGLYLGKSDGNVTVWFPGARFANSEVFIPLSIFAENWRDSELGQQIKQRAPHLFQ